MPTFALQQQQSLSLNNRVLTGLKILQLSQAQLSETISELLEKNPLLETSEPEQPTEDLKPVEPLKNQEKLDVIERASSSEIKKDSGHEESYLPDQAQIETLTDFLSRQCDYSSEEESIKSAMMAIIYALDEDGYLRTSAAELTNDFQFSNQTFELALNAVQGFEPSGVGATSLTECLTLQLIQDYPNHPAQNLAVELVTNQLALLADYPDCIAVLAETLTTEQSTVEHAYQLIQQLNPRPGYDFHSSDNHYIKPDIVIVASKESTNTFEAKIINQPHKLRLNKRMIDLVKNNTSLQKQNADNEAKEWLESNREEAENIINALDFRQSTLQRIANFLAQLQADYFARGLTHLKPLSLTQVAEQLTVNPSTLSRAIANKYITSPQGIEPIRQLFSTALPKQPHMTNRHAKFVLLNLVKQEPAQSPLSDEALANAMRNTGIDISRRAVTKYRLALKIANSRDRKIPNR